MKNNINRLILTIYLLISISISGYLYINPNYIPYRVYIPNGWRFQYNADYTNFKYSVLISILIGIILISIMGYLQNKKPNG